jgi:raffinose/stachyose/melibiose transport system substrate-binding protein
MQRRAVLVYVLVLLVAFPLSVFATGGGEGGAVPTIRMIGNSVIEEGKYLGHGAAIAQFIKNSVGKVKLEYEYVAGDDVFTKMQAEAASGRLPDVWQYWPGPRTAALVESGLVLDAESYLKESKTIKKDSINAELWDVFRVKGMLTGIPTDMIIGAFLYNKAIFAKYNLQPPKTYADMVAAGKVLKDNGIIPFAMASFEGNPSHLWFSIVQFQFKGGIEEVQALGTTNQFDTPNALKTAQLMVQGKTDGLYPKDTLANGQWGPCTALYTERKAAMIYTFPWTFGSWAKEIAGESEVIAVPRMPGADLDPATIADGETNFGIFMSKAAWADKAKKAAVREFVDYYVSADGALLSQKYGVIPVRKDVPLDNLPEITQRVLKFSRDARKYSCHWSKTTYSPASVEFQYALDELFAGTLAPNAFVARVQKVYDEGKAK